MVPVCKGVETDKLGDEAIRTAGTVQGPNLYNDATARQPKRRKKTTATTRALLEWGNRKYGGELSVFARVSRAVMQSHSNSNDAMQETISIKGYT